MTRARVTLAIAFSALAFTACGGGGSDGSGSGNCTANPTGPGCTSGGGTGGGTSGGGTSTNKVPTAKANGPYTSVAGGSISFSGSGSSDPEDQPAALTYAWDFGDGATGTGLQVSHVYTADKVYKATLKVTDTKGAFATDTATVTITAKPAPPPPAAPQVGTIGIYLTDAPFVFDSVASATMFVVRVDARFAEPTSAAELNAPVTGDPSTGWVTVVSPSQAYDLLTLQGGVTKALGSKTDLPVGTYSGFRVVLDVAQSNIALQNGTKPTINWGATGQVTYKITAAEPVVLGANAVNNVTVDFDLGRSFSSLGTSASAGFDAAPSLRTVAAGQRASLIGLLRDQNDKAYGPGITIELLTAGTALSDQSRDKIVATAGTDAQGVFKIVNLQPGTYVLRATFPARYNPRANPQGGDVSVTASTASQASPVRVFNFELPK